jgi:hypothetical protein
VWIGSVLRNLNHDHRRGWKPAIVESEPMT